DVARGAAGVGGRGAARAAGCRVAAARAGAARAAGVAARVAAAGARSGDVAAAGAAARGRGRGDDGAEGARVFHRGELEGDVAIEAEVIEAGHGVGSVVADLADLVEMI